MGVHDKNCAAAAAVRHRKRKTVWMTPELVDNKLVFVCADAGCRAKLQVINLDAVKLPRL